MTDLDLSTAITQPMDVLLEVHKARQQISELVRQHAGHLEQFIGVGWRVALLAPDGRLQLQAELRTCRLTRLPLRVHAAHPSRTVFDESATEGALRFCEAIHALESERISSAAESVLVADEALRAISRGHLDSEGLAFRLLWATTVGRATYRMAVGADPHDGLRFAVRCLTTPLDEVVEIEQDLAWKEVD